MKKISLLILSLILISITVFGQVDETAEEVGDAKQAKKEERAKKKAEKVEMGKFMISPIAGPGYTPELGGVFVIGGLPSFRTSATDKTLPRSSMPFTIGYTTTGAITNNAVLTSYWWHDKLRINGDFYYKDMPDHYWGVGYENGYSTPRTDSTTAFNRLWWWANPRFLFQIKKDYFLGLNLDLNYTQGSDASRGVAADAHYIEFNNKPLNVGLGLILRYDSRDLSIDAREGLLLDFRSTFYSTAFGGDNAYRVFQLDYRQFQTLTREGMTLAWQMKTRIGVGDIPYGEMSQIGTPFDLRGYPWGKYRDESMFYFIAEYRHTFLRKNMELSKHGAVAWIASGTIFDFQTLKENNNLWLPNFGVGYRFEIQPRMNVRIDYGIGRESSGFYFNFNQAF